MFHRHFAAESLNYRSIEKKILNKLVISMRDRFDYCNAMIQKTEI
jgi:hypothetical protein